MAGVTPLSSPLNPDQQALYARLAIANLANPTPGPSPTPPPNWPPQPIPPPNTPPGQPLPPPDLSNAVAMSNTAPQPSIYTPSGPNANAASAPVPQSPPQLANAPSFNQMPVPGQPGQVIPSQGTLTGLAQQYADSPAVQSAMTALAGDKPQYQSPTYHPPNKWAMLASALVGLAFPYSPIARAASGFAQGEEAGAQERFKREQEQAAAQYQGEVDQQTADQKQSQLAIQFSDAQASIAERRIRDEASAEATRVRLEQGWARVHQGAERLGLVRERLRQQYQLAQQRFSVIMRGQDITAHDKVLDANTRLITSQLGQLGADRRAMLNANVRTAVAGASQIQRTLDQNLITIREQVNKGKMTQDQAKAAVGSLEQAAHDQISGLLDKGTTGTKLDGISSLASGLDSGMLEDDQNAANAAMGGNSYGNYPTQYEPGSPPVTVNVNTGGEGGNLYGGTIAPGSGYDFVNQPLGGPATPANQSGGQRTQEAAAGATHDQRLAAQTQAYQQHLASLAAGANLGKGPGAPEPTFKQMRELAAQHAADFPTAAALLNAIKASPAAPQLSAQQAAQIVETWAHTRRGQGLGVDVAPPPGQTPPASALPASPESPGGLDISKPGLGLTPNVSQAPEGSTGPQSGQTPGPQPTVGEAAVAAAHKVGIPPQLVLAVMKNESSGNQGAVSNAGAIGRMQLMPGTAESLGVDPHNPAANIYGGAVYLSQLVRKFGSIPWAIAAYNAGPEAVIKYHGIPPFPETRAYVSAVLQSYRELMRTSQAPGNF